MFDFCEKIGCVGVDLEAGWLEFVGFSLSRLLAVLLSPLYFIPEHYTPLITTEFDLYSGSSLSFRTVT